MTLNCRLYTPVPFPDQSSSVYQGLVQGWSMCVQETDPVEQLCLVSTEPVGGEREVG